MIPPGVPGVTAASGPNSGGYGHALRLEELRRRSRRRDAERVDADDLLRCAGCRSAPASRRPRRACPTSCRSAAIIAARGVDGVAALLEDHRARGRRERLAGDRHPLLARGAAACWWRRARPRPRGPRPTRRRLTRARATCGPVAGSSNPPRRSADFRAIVTQRVETPPPDPVGGGPLRMTPGRCEWARSPRRVPYRGTRRQAVELDPAVALSRRRTRSVADRPPRWCVFAHGLVRGRRRLRAPDRLESRAGARRRAPPSGGRERKHTTKELLLPDCDCAFALERRPDLERRPAVACRRREDGPTPGRICCHAGRSTH